MRFFMMNFIATRCLIVASIVYSFYIFQLVSPLYADSDLPEKVNSEESSDPSYPGEEQKTSSGKTIKRWSTKGPVPIQRQDSVDQNLNNRDQNRAISDTYPIIVDTRKSVRGVNE